MELSSWLDSNLTDPFADLDLDPKKASDKKDNGIAIPKVSVSRSGEKSSPADSPQIGSPTDYRNGNSKNIDGEHLEVPSETILGTSPLHFFDRVMKSLYSKIKPTSSSSSSTRPKFKREVRSAFGWTDIPQEEEEKLDSIEPKKATFSEQDRLGFLPVPDLKATCTKYLKTVQPLLTEEEFSKTKQAVEEFMQPGGIGEKLQELLVSRAKSEKFPSWLEPWWDDAYLCDREAIPINVNYFFVFEDDPVPQKNHQIGKAASLLRGALVFKQLLDNEKVEPDYERDKPLCMSQYPRVFGASRIPGLERDSIITYSKYKPSGRDALSKTTEYVEMSPSHVVVLYMNQFFWFDVFVNGKLLPLEEIEGYLNSIVQTVNSDEDTEFPIGLFTAQERTLWAKLRHQLVEISEVNKANLEKIQSALLIVVLDSAAPSNLTELSRLILHGPVTNRWFDKHQLIVCANGKAGMNFEHSVGDGTTTLRVADEMHQYSVKYGRAEPNLILGNSKPPATKLLWKVSPELEQEFENCYEIFKHQILTNETSTLVFEEYGGQFIKDSSMSPDAFVQIAMQLAFFKMFGRPGATYESASTRGFLHGRTETVRTVSTDSLNFVKSTLEPLMFQHEDGKYSTKQAKLLKEATEAHVKYMRDAKEGKGVDRHLFGLRMVYEAHHEELGPRPAIFTDPAYKKSSHWFMSTSHCGSSSLSLFGFGPVVSDGFGIGYMIKNNSIHFNVTSKFTGEMTSAASFTKLLFESLCHLQAICCLKPVSHSGSLDFTHPTNSAETRFWRPKHTLSNSPPKY